MKLEWAMADGNESGSKPRVEEILDTATRLFAENGFAGTSIQDLADAVGIHKASLFHYFSSKDVLYEAVLDRLVGSLREPLARIYESGGSYAERLDAVTETLVIVFGSHPYAARLLLREVMDRGPIMRGKRLEAILDVLEAGAAWVRAGQKTGAFAEDDPKQIILTALGVHLIPFALAELVERYMGRNAFDPSFVAARLRSARRQMRAMHLK